MISRELSNSEADSAKASSNVNVTNICNNNNSAEKAAINDSNSNIEQEVVMEDNSEYEKEQLINNISHQNYSSVLNDDDNNNVKEKESKHDKRKSVAIDKSSNIITENNNKNNSDGLNGNVWYRVVPALSSGAIQAVLFNPIDRALYLRVTFRRSSFLDRRNFDRPFQGFMNAAVYRTLVGACYLFWQDTFHFYIQRHLPSWCQEDVSPQLNAMLIGFTAGASNGLALNALQAIKFRMWNENLKDVSFWKTARLMHAEAGWRIFLRGSLTTVVRDSTFGVIYEITRRSTFLYKTFNYLLANSKTDFKHITIFNKKEESHKDNNVINDQQCEVSPLAQSGKLAMQRKNKQAEEAEESPSLSVSVQKVETNSPQETINTNNSSLLSCHPVSRFGMSAFIVNLIAAMTASILSSPLNYVRNVIYGTPHSAVPLGYWVLLRSFYTQFVYILTHGESYVVRHGSGELAERERIPNVKTKPRNSVSTSFSSSSYSSSSPLSTLNNQSATTHHQINAHTNRFHQTQVSKIAQLDNVNKSVLVNMRRWLTPREYYVRAAWRWSNSRLNIGWGSIRVGVGMALSQSCFYIIQDWFEEKSNTSATVGSGIKR